MTNRRPDIMLLVICFLILLFLVDFVGDWRSTSATNRLRDALVDRCEQRQEEDKTAVTDLQARIDLYAEIIEMERGNRFVDEAFRARRVRAYTNAMTQAQVRLSGIPAPISCSTYYAEAR